ncbi:MULTISPECIES: VanZ family protein [Myroides]|uniref:VanZ family protein n=1 Tax=Myroides albus TaxID=2562892 RepID=A0A6I3LBL1_9FLAO|nr:MULTISPECIES: VanZ family protein [Myroides]MTG96839.1 VanZ family protein [Myroides albus]MVX36944.1 VanZ family protein [Myroides sp. LoEW2-1]UVD78411.1 VanZ family protein [Myroides albus]
MGRKFFFWLGVIWTVLVLIACLSEGSSIPKVSVLDIPFKDKIAHFVFYLVFSVLWYNYFAKSWLKISRISLTFVIFTLVIVIGGTVELLQLYCTKSRSAEWADFFANCLGSITGLILCNTTIKK